MIFNVSNHFLDIFWLDLLPPHPELSCCKCVTLTPCSPTYIKLLYIFNDYWVIYIIFNAWLEFAQRTERLKNYRIILYMSLRFFSLAPPSRLPPDVVVFIFFSFLSDVLPKISYKTTHFPEIIFSSYSILYFTSIIPSQPAWAFSNPQNSWKIFHNFNVL